MSSGKYMPLVIAGLVAGGVAAGVTVGVASIALAADVSLEVQDKQIPVSAFAFWTIIASLIGIGLAIAVKRRRLFVIITAVATGLSLVPAAIAPDDAATSLVLVAAHLLAAVIVIPALARQLAGEPAVGGDADREPAAEPA